MKVLDPGHIYQLSKGVSEKYTLTFIKRGGGAIQYERQWPGIQTQAIMRAIINHLDSMFGEGNIGTVTYDLFQLGVEETFPLTICNLLQIRELLSVLIDRSRYLNGILECTETHDAITYLAMASTHLTYSPPDLLEAMHYVRLALWSYEARAYRRKQEEVNREEPAHDDTERLRAWREFPAADVPFNEENIEDIPIGKDGHIVLS